MSSLVRLCRLCLEPEAKVEYTKIFKRSGKIPELIFSFIGIKVENHKSFPSLICEKCLGCLNDSESFKRKCLDANKVFNQLKETFISNSPKIKSEDDSEEKNVNFLANSSSTAKKEKKRYRPICGYCGKEQESEYRLRQHELLSHTSITQLSPSEIIVCDFCGGKFKTKQSLRNHFVRAHTPKSEVFPCSICGKVLPHLKALYAHERVHIKTEATCQYCSKTFSRRVLLSSHIAIVHLKKRLSQCQYCPHQAITSGALKKHIRCKHLNVRNHHCDWPECGKSFHENQHLIRHRRTHTHERPFACRNEGCGKAFSDHAKRTRHEKQNCPNRETLETN